MSDIDTIVSQITDNRKTVLQAISTDAGYSFTPGVVELERVILDFKGHDIFMRLLKLDADIEVEGNSVDVTDIHYLVETIIIDSDEGATDEEIVYKYRNVNGDVIKAWMGTPDHPEIRNCGGLVEINKSLRFYDGTVQDSKGNRAYQAINEFSVTARIDSYNPCLLG